MKVLLQSEVAECGLVSLAMVAGMHGGSMDMTELRRRFPTSLKGARLADLIQVAGRLGFNARPLRLEMDDLGKLKLPCILHWDLNHFVVLAKRAGNSVIVLDPAVGKRKLRLAAVAEHFTGVALELAPTERFQIGEPVPSVSVRVFFNSLRGVWRSLAHVLALSLALHVFVVAGPFLMQLVLDHVLVAAEQDLLVVLGIGFLLLLLFEVATALLRGWSVLHVSSQVGLQWMASAFGHLLRLPMAFFERRHLGDIISRMGSIQAIQRTVTTSAVEAIADGLMAIGTLAMMLIYSWKLTLITLAAATTYAVVRALSYGTMRNRTDQQLMTAARQQSYVLESLRGMQTLKLACAEDKRLSTYQNLVSDTVDHEVRLGLMGVGLSGANRLIFGAERIAVIWIGALLALQNVLSAGMLVAYMAYKDQFSQRIAALLDRFMEFRMLRVHSDRLADIVLAPADTRSDAMLVAPQLARFSIQVDNLWFRFSESEPWVLQGCTFSVDCGESVAIVGASGCGKTTLVKLILGLLVPNEGTICIDGQDIKSLGPQSVRAMVGTVMQEDMLFTGSLADNISFFDPAHDDARVQEAARNAGIHGDICAMPMGYQSLIGDMGSSLSGGQRQRVILARALYRAPRMLVMDEATSHLDVTTERAVSAAVQALRLTKLIVAHRPETIASADRVLVLAEGRVAAAANSLD